MKKAAFKSSYVFAKYFFLLVLAHVGTPAGKCRAGGSGGVPSIYTKPPCQGLQGQELVMPAGAACEVGCLQGSGDRQSLVVARRLVLPMHQPRKVLPTRTSQGSVQERG